MTEREHIMILIEEFTRIQRYMRLVDNDSDAYREMKLRYTELKAFLTDSGTNLTALDIIKE